MLNLNQVKEQSQGSRTIPPLSKVMVRLSIQAPPAEKQGSMPELIRSQNSSLEYLSTILEVINGSFQGVKIYHNFNVAGASTENHEKAISISMSTIRAIVEAHNSISPKDMSERASRLRMLESFSQIHGMVFPIMVKCEESRPSKDGQIFMNNALRNIVTIDDADFTLLISKGEILSREAIPQVGMGQGGQGGRNTRSGQSTQGTPQRTPQPPWANSVSNASSNSQPPVQNQVWQAPQTQAQQQIQQPLQQTNRQAQTHQGYAPPPLQYGSPFPSEANDMDDTPF